MHAGVSDHLVRHTGWVHSTRTHHHRVLVCLSATKEPHACPSGPKKHHPATYTNDATFAVFKHLNTAQNLEAALDTLDVKHPPHEPASCALISKHKRTRSTDCDCCSTGTGASSQPPSPNQASKPRRLGVRQRTTPATSAALFLGNLEPCDGRGAPIPVTTTRLAKSPATALKQLAEIVAATGCLDIKEVLEAVEFVERVRKRVRRRCMLDLAAGHGLVGILLAAVEPEVERVLLVDHKQPKAFSLLFDAVAAVAPRVAHSVMFFTGDVFELERAVVARCTSGAGPETDADAALFQVVGTLHAAAAQGALGVTAVHACGSLTDSCLRTASVLRAPVAVMPCCYTGTAKATPLAVRRLLGVDKAADVDRCFRLQQAGCYSVVDVSSIPAVITPMNRIIVAEVAQKSKVSNVYEQLAT